MATPSSLASRLEVLDSHFGRIYGAARWASLRRGLAEPTRHIGWVNPFRGGGEDSRPAPPEGWEVVRHSRTSMLVHAGEAQLPQPSRTHGLLDHYPLDGGSALAALALEPRRGERVLDLCAAPGGKTLFLASELAAGGVLVANEKVASRRARLRRVLESYLPGPVLRLSELAAATRLADAKLHVALADLDATDARALRALPLDFDKILVDAPCSMERHFLHGRADSPWTPKRIARDAKLQLNILKAALVALKRGGRLVYSTCSIAHEENDAVVDALIAKTAAPAARSPRRLRLDDPLRALPPFLTRHAERTDRGAILLPDRSGFGPLYVAVFVADLELPTDADHRTVPPPAEPAAA